MKVRFQTQGYKAADVRSRYVRASAYGIYFWCEVGDDRRYDIRQGTVEPQELPEAVKAAADALRGTWPGYVDWPHL